ncbi:MAG: hypothetical protein ACFNVM_02315 [Neisseria elongata]
MAFWPEYSYKRNGSYYTYDALRIVESKREGWELRGDDTRPNHLYTIEGYNSYGQYVIGEVIFARSASDAQEFAREVFADRLVTQGHEDLYMSIKRIEVLP